MNLFTDASLPLRSYFRAHNTNSTVMKNAPVEDLGTSPNWADLPARPDAVYRESMNGGKL